MLLIAMYKHVCIYVVHDCSPGYAHDIVQMTLPVTHNVWQSKLQLDTGQT